MLENVVEYSLVSQEEELMLLQYNLGLLTGKGNLNLTLIQQTLCRKSLRHQKLCRSIKMWYNNLNYSFFVMYSTK